MYNKLTKEDISRIIKHPVYFLAFGLGLGLMPIVPGTFGTILGVIIYVINNLYFGLNEILVITIGFLIGVYLCHKTAKDFAYHDHPGIVWDEVIGYLVTMLFIPYGIINILTGFILFRIFDVIKPWPIGLIDKKVDGGLGIMLDDILAGVYANLCFYVLFYFNIL